MTLFALLLHPQICLLPQHKEFFGDHTTLSDKHFADNILVCQDQDSLKSANYVLLFEDTYLLKNLINAIRCVCDEYNKLHNS